MDLLRRVHLVQLSVDKARRVSHIVYQQKVNIFVANDIRLGVQNVLNFGQLQSLFRIVVPFVFKLDMLERVRHVSVHGAGSVWENW